MNRDLGVWTYEDCALVLIDYQKEIFEVIRSETSANLVDLDRPRHRAHSMARFDAPHPNALELIIEVPTPHRAP